MSTQNTVLCQALAALFILIALSIYGHSQAEEPLEDPAQAPETEETPPAELSEAIEVPPDEHVPSSATGSDLLSPHDPQGPTFEDVIIQLPPLKDWYGRQTALKDDDKIDFILRVSDTEGVQSVVADISQLGMGRKVILEDQGIEDRFQYLQAHIGSGLMSGARIVTFTATDTNGNVSTFEKEVLVDTEPPQVTVTWSARNSGRVVQYAPAYISGDFSDNLTTARLIEGRRYPHDISGVLIQSPIHWGGLDNGLAGTTTAFSDISIPIAEFDAQAAIISFELMVVDGAGNRGYATSSPMRYYVAGTEPPPTPSASNVLFLPGIKSSYLYAGDGEQLWLPGIAHNDVRELFLNPDGTSARADIYVRTGAAGVVTSIPGSDIYASFFRDLDALQLSGTINDWQPTPYDWRLSLFDLVTKGAERNGRVYYGDATNTPYIAQSLRRLAASSKTGKVTIVAHSNGGLVAKALLRELGDAETASLVDQIILVGVPQTGAPQSIAAILFGFREALPGRGIPFLVSASDARQFAINSPMGYHLLPSSAYFEGIRNVATFPGGETYAREIGTYGTSIDSWSEIERFMRAEEGGRVPPQTDDLKHAAIANSSLLTYAQRVHASLDTWTPPSSVQVHQVAGTGKSTVSGVEFYEQRFPGFSPQRLYRPTFIREGDGVVPVTSAHELPGKPILWFDIDGFNYLNPDRDHGTLFGVPELRTFLRNTITNASNALPEFLSTSEPAVSERKWLRFFLHSPLSLEVTDAMGRRVGKDGDSLILEEVDDSSYGIFGEIQYVEVPSGGDYTVTLRGENVGRFSLDVQEVQGDMVTSTAVMADLPATSNTLATFRINDSIATASALKVDIDGDGALEVEMQPVPGETVHYVNLQIGDESPTTGKNRREREVAMKQSNAQTSISKTPAKTIQSSVGASQEAVQEVTQWPAGAVPEAAMVRESIQTENKSASGEALSASAWNAVEGILNTSGKADADHGFVFSLILSVALFLSSISDWLMLLFS